MAPFYVSICVHAIYVFSILFLLPESLSTQSRLILSKNAEIARTKKRRQEQLEREWENETPQVEASDPFLSASAGNNGESGWSRITGGGSKRSKKFYGRSRRSIQRLFGFLEPVAIFLPREREEGSWQKGKDWNLTFVGIAVFLGSMLMVCL